MLKRWFERFSKIDTASSLAGWIVQGLTFVTGVTLSGLLAWALTTWDWYWSTFNLAGVAFAFIMAWLLLGLGVLLAGLGFAAWRGPYRPTPPANPVGSQPLAVDDERVSELDAFRDHASEKLAEFDAYMRDFVKVLADSENRSKQRSDAIVDGVNKLVGRIEALSNRVDGIDKTISPNPAGLLGLGDYLDPNGPKNRFERIERRIDGLVSQMKESSDSHTQMVASVHALVIKANKNHGELADRVRGVLRAREDRETIKELTSEAEALEKKLETARDAPQTTDWVQWNNDFGAWRRTLSDLARVAKHYVDVSDVIFHIPPTIYNSGNWNMSFDDFPHRDRVIEFMTYRTILLNYRNVRPDIDHHVAHAVVI